MENKNVPRVRFEGFNDAWEQRKLGDTVEITMGQSPDSKNYTKNSLDHILVQGNADMKNGKVFPRVWTTQVTKLANIGDIIMSVRAPVGDVGKTEYEVVLGRGVASLKGNSFIFQYVIRMKETGFWSKIVTGSTFESINSKDIFNAKIIIPSGEEQKYIGIMLDLFDTTIASNQRKLDSLKKVKKAMMQKTFDQTWRFEGFTDPWEQRKLSFISDKVTIKNKENKYKETFTNSAEYGIISQLDFFDKDISNSKNLSGYYIVKPNDFVYNPRISNFAPVGPIKRNKLERTGIMSPLYYIFKTKNIDNSYLEIFFNSSEWHKFMKLNGDSGARSDRFSIKDSVFNEMPIPVPIEKEQNRIGRMFIVIDQTIASNQLKIDKLKETKKWLMKNMFV